MELYIFRYKIRLIEYLTINQIICLAHWPLICSHSYPSIFQKFVSCYFIVYVLTYSQTFFIWNWIKLMVYIGSFSSRCKCHHNSWYDGRYSCTDECTKVVAGIIVYCPYQIRYIKVDISRCKYSFAGDIVFDKLPAMGGPAANEIPMSPLRKPIACAAPDGPHMS